MFKKLVCGNEIIEEKIHNAIVIGTKLAHIEVLGAIREQLINNKSFIVPTVNVIEEGQVLLFRTVFEHGCDWIPMFTTWEEFNKGPKRKIVYIPIRKILQMIIAMDDIAGIALNPMGECGFIEKSDLEQILMT